jgi:cobalt-zinc-cadmium efflux system protein
MEPTHSHNSSSNLGFAFKTGITINIIFIIVEVLFGLFSNSMALIADAGHNTSDVLALVFSWIAIRISQRKPTVKFTYGFRRSTILIAILNTVLLIVAVIIIIYETFKRINNPIEIKADSVIIVAAIGIVVNAFTAWLFMKENRHDLNIRSAFVHFIADALVSFGVVVGGFVMLFTGLQRVDSVVSFVIIAVILYSVYRLLIDSVNLALDAVPENINIEEVRTYLKKLPGVEDVHDLHVWALSTSDAALTVHLTTSEQTDLNFITAIQNQLQNQFNIGHATIQIEFGDLKNYGITN